MSTEEQIPTNSLNTNEIKTPTTEACEENNSTYKKKDFVFTDKRKENLVKANKARKEKEDFKKQLREKYEATTIELQKLYESKINTFKNNTDISTNMPSINPPTADKSPEKIEIQPVEKQEKKKSKKPVVESSSDSEESEEEIQRKPKKRKTSSKKVKKVVYVSETESSSEEEEIIVRKKKQKKARRKYSDSESEDENEPTRPNIHRNTNMGPPHGLYGGGVRKVGAISGCIF
jgi:hypothetical protein